MRALEGRRGQQRERRAGEAGRGQRDDVRPPDAQREAQQAGEVRGGMFGPAAAAVPERVQQPPGTATAAPPDGVEQPLSRTPVLYGGTIGLCVHFPFAPKTSAVSDEDSTDSGADVARRVGGAARGCVPSGTPSGILRPMSAPRQTMPRPAAAADVDKMVNRLKRIEGQVRGLQRMVSEGAPCEDVLTQLSATRAALDRAGITLITAKVRDCLLEDGDVLSEVAVQRALETFQRYAQHLQVQPDPEQA